MLQFLARGGDLVGPESGFGARAGVSSGLACENGSDRSGYQGEEVNDDAGNADSVRALGGSFWRHLALGAIWLAFIVCIFGFQYWYLRTGMRLAYERWALYFLAMLFGGGAAVGVLTVVLTS
jgi:hypothetical protein